MTLPTKSSGFVDTSPDRLVVSQKVGDGAIESVLARGDLSKLTEQQRTDYYIKLCQSLGLNPLTGPFEYLTLNNRLVLYAKRACADQLRKINGITIQIMSQDQNDGLLTVHVRAKDATGREDEDLGVVNFPDTLKGEARANAILKAVTKAKRRVTLSISGLGFLDETEVEDIPATAKKPLAPTSQVVITPPSEPVSHDPQTGEVLPIIRAPGVIAVSDPPNWTEFGQFMIAAIKGDVTKADEWLSFNSDTCAQMKKDAPKIHTRMMAAIDNVRRTPQEPF